MGSRSEHFPLFTRLIFECLAIYSPFPENPLLPTHLAEEVPLDSMLTLPTLALLSPRCFEPEVYIWPNWTEFSLLELWNWDIVTLIHVPKGPISNENEWNSPMRGNGEWAIVANGESVPCLKVAAATLLRRWLPWEYRSRLDRYSDFPDFYVKFPNVWILGTNPFF